MLLPKDPESISFHFPEVDETHIFIKLIKEEEIVYNSSVFISPIGRTLDKLRNSRDNRLNFEVIEESGKNDLFNKKIRVKLNRHNLSQEDKIEIAKRLLEEE